jgi:hypothetical protein
MYLFYFFLGRTTTDLLTPSSLVVVTAFNGIKQYETIIKTFSLKSIFFFFKSDLI